MKLQSASNFVLEQNIRHNGEYTGVEMTNLLVTLYGNIVRYANFLKQPLTLSMFVPCGDDGEVLEEPEIYKITAKTGTLKEEIEYKQAKERCLFEGFFVSENKDTKPTEVKSITNGKFHFFWFNSEKKMVSIARYFNN